MSDRNPNISLFFSYLREDDLVVRVANLDVHPDPLRRRGKTIRPRVVELHFVIACNKFEIGIRLTSHGVNAK